MSRLREPYRVLLPLEILFGVASVAVDVTLMNELIGPSLVPWQDGMQHIVEKRVGS